MLNEETGGYNKTGIVIAICAILELAVRPSSFPANETKSDRPKDVSNNTKDIPRNWMASSIALGSLFFTLHCMFTDSNTVIAWSWTGYQDGHPRGPVPRLHGSITLFAQAFGLIIPAVLPASVSSALLNHTLWFVYGCASALVMYHFRDWTGFLGGLNFAIFCMSILPSVLSQSSAWQGDKVGRRHFVTFFVAILFYLANVWTVAYAFVPGGSYLRERTDLYVYPALFCSIFKTACRVLVAQLVAILLAFRPPFKVSTRTDSFLCIPSSTRTHITGILCIFSLVSVLVTLLRWPTMGPRPFKPGTRVFNAGVWTIHFGIDNVGYDSQRRIRDVIRYVTSIVSKELATALIWTLTGICNSMSSAC